MKLLQLKSDLFIPEDFAKNHYYFADAEGKKKYTGITTVLGTLAKPMLIPWAAKMAVEYIEKNCKPMFGDAGDAGYFVALPQLEEAKNAHSKKKEKAGEHGTSMHSLVEQWVNDCLTQNSGSPIEHMIEYAEPIKAFVVWAVENVDHFLFSERPVHSKSLFLAGTIDFGAVLKSGKRVIGDLKTGSNIYYEAILQCEAYQLLAEEEGDEKYQGSVIVLLAKDGTFQIQERERGEIDEDAFFGLYSTYRGAQSYQKPNK